MGLFDLFKENEKDYEAIGRKTVAYTELENTVRKFSKDDDTFAENTKKLKKTSKKVKNKIHKIRKQRNQDFHNEFDISGGTDEIYNTIEEIKKAEKKWWQF